MTIRIATALLIKGRSYSTREQNHRCALTETILPNIFSENTTNNETYRKYIVRKNDTGRGTMKLICSISTDKYKGTTG